ncbi:MAG: hypothetical protein STSR0009_25410 [Methanoregula sp.]
MRVADMRGGTDAGGKEHHAGLLRAHRNPTRAPFCAGEIAFPVCAETAEITERQVERGVTFEEVPVPVPERNY